MDKQGLDGPTIVGIVAAAIALCAMAVSIWQAVVARIQARHAKAQADAAIEQVALMRKQVEQAERDHALAVQMHKEEQEARRFALELSAKPVLIDGHWYLEVRVENNCQRSANIQRIEIVFGDGSTWTHGGFDGEITPKGLPGTLQHGGYFVYRFYHIVQHRDSRGGSWPQATTPDYGEGRWRNISHIQVTANNQLFRLTGEESSQHPPLWKSQFQTYPTRL